MSDIGAGGGTRAGAPDNEFSVLVGHDNCNDVTRGLSEIIKLCGTERSIKKKFISWGSISL